MLRTIFVERSTSSIHCIRSTAAAVSRRSLVSSAYREVGSDYLVDNGKLVKGLEALKCFESVSRRLSLARLTVPLLKSVEYLDRGSTGCCWEVLMSRKDPDNSIGALRQAKSLTLTLASHLADFVAETLRASRTLQEGPLTDEENIHLLGANFWVQPIYQELLHAASGHNVSGDGERKQPCSGLVKIVAKPRRDKTRVPAVDTACVADWIGDHCPADSLMIWFPAHWAHKSFGSWNKLDHTLARNCGSLFAVVFLWCFCGGVVVFL